MSLARSQFELANVALEDVILFELDGHKGSLQAMEENLNSSVAHLSQMDDHLVALREKMEEARFEDLPTLHSLDLQATGDCFVGAGLVCDSSWSEVVGLARAGGFRAVLEVIQARIAILGKLTSDLLKVTRNLNQAASHGQVHVVLEENQTGNLRVPFAQLYNEWTGFQGFFLASTMLSTEQWYVFMGHGGLMGKPNLLPVSTSIPADAIS